jgi:hypothetical protein
MDLAFEDADLVAEGQNLDLECGFGLPAEDKEVEQGADDGVEEAQDHGQGSWSGRISALPVSRRSSEVASQGTIHILERHTPIAVVA